MVLGITALAASLAGLSYGVVANTMTATNLPSIEVHMAMETGLNFKDMQNSLNSLAEMALDHCLVLGFRLAEQGGVCVLVNTSCHTYTNTSGTVQECIKQILEQAK
jgi:hypothetical protein